MSSLAQLMETKHQRYLKRWLTATHVQPLLLSGSSEQDLNSLVTVITQLFACEQSHDAPCTTCRGCRTALLGHHPDIIVNAESKTTIKTLRQLLTKAHTSGFHAKKLIVLAHLDTYSLPAANILLKALEDSPPSLHYLITTQFYGKIIPTIRSRCHTLFIQSSSAQEKMYDITSLIGAKRLPALTDEHLASIQTFLMQAFRAQGPTKLIHRALLRLRDYYKVKSTAGNEKLASDIVVACLSGIQYDRHYGS